MNFEKAVKVVLQHEGGFVDRKEDHGGPTNFGITLATLKAWRASKGQTTPVTADDVRKLTQREAQEIYRGMFWEPNGFDAITSETLATVIFDQSIPSGPHGAITRLQMNLGVQADGVLGPTTIRALEREHPDDAAFKFVRSMMHHYTGIVAANPTQAIFIGGWIDRAMSLLDYVFFGEIA